MRTMQVLANFVKLFNKEPHINSRGPDFWKICPARGFPRNFIENPEFSEKNLENRIIGGFSYFPEDFPGIC